MTRNEALRRLNQCDGFGIPCGYLDGNRELFEYCRKVLEQTCANCKYAQINKSNDRKHNCLYCIRLGVNVHDDFYCAYYEQEG